jgi:hypothetical protein
VVNFVGPPLVEESRFGKMGVDMDSNILGLDERIKNAIQAGETQYREFKTAWQRTADAKVPRPAHTIRKDIGETF